VRTQPLSLRKPILPACWRDEPIYISDSCKGLAKIGWKCRQRIDMQNQVKSL